jgi:DNA-binding NtrC family response regulator
MKKSILVIDDEEGIRRSFILALEDSDYSIDTAASGEAGIEKRKIKPYDLIFLDLKMPGLNGVETLDRIRKLDEYVPVYILTAFYKDYFQQLKVVRDKGIDFNIIQKPIGMDQIIKATKGILEGPVSDLES